MQMTRKAGFGQTYKAAIVIAIITVGVALGAVSILSYYQVSQVSPEYALSQGIASFQSNLQLQNFIAANAESAQRYDSGGFFLGGPVGGFALASNAGTVPQAEFAPASAAISTPSYTGTNDQVAGVDEPDMVKTDGTNLFVATGNSVAIISAYPPGASSTLATLSFGSAAVLGLEIAQNRLLVIDQRNTNTTYIDLVLYNDTNLSSPRLLENMSIAGTYVSARLAQGYLYAVVQQPSYEFNNEGNASVEMPSLIENGVAVSPVPSSIYYTPNHSQISYYTFVISMSLSNGKESTLTVLTGPSSTIYVSNSNVYVVYSNYPVADVDGILGDAFTGGVISSSDVQVANSTIFRAAYSNGNVTLEAAGSIPGTILNQFSLNEYGNYFIVATSRFATVGSTSTTSDDVYVLSMNMSQVSSLQNIAPGENIYAVRFVGDMGYVVTFEQVDPLFTISFKNILHPVILSALHVPGYSDYLQPLFGNYLIGVGKNTVASSSGDFAFYLGIKLSLFDIANSGVSTEVANYSIGDRGTDSPVLDDHLAFTYDPANNITVIPITLALVSDNQSGSNPPPYGNDVWQGAYVFRVSSSGFSLLGRVTQYPSSVNYSDATGNNLDIYRSVIIGNYLYTISEDEVMISSLSTLATVVTIPLPVANS